MSAAARAARRASPRAPARRRQPAAQPKRRQQLGSQREHAARGRVGRARGHGRVWQSWARDPTSARCQATDIWRCAAHLCHALDRKPVDADLTGGQGVVKVEYARTLHRGHRQPRAPTPTGRAGDATRSRAASRQSRRVAKAVDGAVPPSCGLVTFGAGPDFVGAQAGAAGHPVPRGDRARADTWTAKSARDFLHTPSTSRRCGCPPRGCSRRARRAAR